jgi:uncharacterized protein (TIGR02996 family)
MTSEQLAQRDVFLAEIRDAPDEDLPRLVLGDWLLDLGDPRGEFIQIDVQLPQLPDGPQKQELEQRRRELLRVNAMRWLGPLMDLVSAWRWERGMLHVEARAERFGDEAWLEAARSEAFAWVLGAQVVIGHSPVRPRLWAEFLGGIVALDLSGNELRDATAFRYLLRHGGRLRGLRWLALANNRLGPTAIAAIAACPHLAGLTRLDLSGNELDDDAARALIESPHLNRLRRLDLGRTTLLLSTVVDLVARFGAGVVQVELV